MKVKHRDVKNKMWLPDTNLLFVHTKDLVNDGVVIIYNDGEVKRRREYHLEIHYKPYSEQGQQITKTLTFSDFRCLGVRFYFSSSNISIFRYNDQEVNLKWDSMKSLAIDSATSVKISDLKTSTGKKTFDSGAYDQLTVTFSLEPGKRRK